MFGKPEVAGTATKDEQHLGGDTAADACLARTAALKGTEKPESQVANPKVFKYTYTRTTHRFGATRKGCSHGFTERRTSFALEIWKGDNVSVILSTPVCNGDRRKAPCSAVQSILYHQHTFLSGKFSNCCC